MDDGLFAVQYCCYLPGLRCDSLYPYRNRCRIDFRLDFRSGIPYEILCREEGLVVLTTIHDDFPLLTFCKMSGGFFYG